MVILESKIFGDLHLSDSHSVEKARQATDGLRKGKKAVDRTLRNAYFFLETKELETVEK